MKGHKIAKICMMVCLILGMVLIPASKLKVQAAEVIATVQGTILSGTSSDLLKLSTKEYGDQAGQRNGYQCLQDFASG